MAPPDAEHFPHATGLAEKTVKEHLAEQGLKFYAGWFCPFVQRAWMVLEEKKIPYQYIEVNPYHKPQSLLSLNPRGLVPTLEYEGKPLYESNVIMEFLDDAFPDCKGESGDFELRPRDAYRRAKGRIWSDWVGTRFIPAFHQCLQFQPREGQSEDEAAKELQSRKAEVTGLMREFVEEADERGPFFFGARPTMVDLVLAPWANRLWVFDEFKGGLTLPAAEGWVGRWQSWFEAMEGRRSLRETSSEREHLKPMYKKYADDIAQSELAKATRAGRGVP